MDRSPLRGQIWRAQLGSLSRATGHDQAKERPALVVSADFVNRSRADMCIILPLSTTIRSVRSHIRIDPPEGGIDSPSSIQCEQIRAISRERLTDFLGETEDTTMARVDYVLRMILAFS